MGWETQAAHPFGAKTGRPICKPVPCARGITPARADLRFCRSFSLSVIRPAAIGMARALFVVAVVIIGGRLVGRGRMDHRGWARLRVTRRRLIRRRIGLLRRRIDAWALIIRCGRRILALLILLPESVAAIAAAKRNQLQRSINLALGSSLATIGLTIPAVSVAVIVLKKDLVLGLSPREMVLLVMTILVSMLTFGTGRTNILFGLVHVLVFAVFLFTAFVP